MVCKFKNKAFFFFFTPFPWHPNIFLVIGMYKYSYVVIHYNMTSILTWMYVMIDKPTKASYPCQTIPYFSILFQSEYCV